MRTTLPSAPASMPSSTVRGLSQARGYSTPRWAGPPPQQPHGSQPAAFFWIYNLHGLSGLNGVERVSASFVCTVIKLFRNPLGFPQKAVTLCEEPCAPPRRLPYRPKVSPSPQWPPILPPRGSRGMSQSIWQVASVSRASPIPFQPILTVPSLFSGRAGILRFRRFSDLL